MRVALIGCGRIADQHVQAVQRIRGSEVVAVCDREPLMARQLAERFGIAGCFDEVDTMLRVARPNAVHITTPPQSHHSLARQCLEAGSHVYLEKPFAVTADETESLLRLADVQQLRITAGHNYQFTPEMLEMRRLVTEGFLGGAPVHLESYWSYDLGDLNYVGPLIGNRNHWVRQLPGQLLHNIISHGIARLAEFLSDSIAELHVTGSTSTHLRAMGGEDLHDELRVLVRDGNGTTATFCFSTQVKPGLNQLRIFGPANSLSVDLASGSILRHHGRSYKSYLTFLVPSAVNAREHWRNLRRNVVGIAKRQLHQDAGMKELIERFHHSCRDGGTPPIPYREIALTGRLMDSIFAELASRHESSAVGPVHA